jgi:hypothetical protein
MTLEAMDRYYVELAGHLSVEELRDTIRPEFVGGEWRHDIIFH